MPNDPEGVNIAVGSRPWYDDGHSVDANGVPVWVQNATVQGFVFASPVLVVMAPDGGGSNIYIPITLVHVGKPVHPPDRG